MLCCAGQELPLLAAAFPLHRLVGIDLAPGMVTLAQDLVREQGLEDRVTVRCAVEGVCVLQDVGLVPKVHVGLESGWAELVIGWGVHPTGMLDLRLQGGHCQRAGDPAVLVLACL